MTISPFTPFTGNVGPLTRVTPFTHRDNATYLYELETVKKWLTGLVPEVDTRIAQLLTAVGESVTEVQDYADGVIDLVNNKSGPIDIQRATLTAPYTLEIDPLWPDNQPVTFVLTQDSTGGYPVTLGDGVVGSLMVDERPNGVTEFQLVPDGTAWVIYPVTTPVTEALRTLWVNSATGYDGNSGLSETKPLRTLAGVNARLKKVTGPDLRSDWRVRLSGVFEGEAIAGLSVFRNAVIFEGDPLVAGVPQTQIVKGITTKAQGLRLEPGNGAAVIVKNIMFKDFRSSGLGYGIIMKDLGVLEVYDCVADNCDTGFKADRNVSFSGVRLKATNCTTGFIGLYSSSGTWDNCTAISCTVGFFCSRNAVMHVDYSVITDCPTAIQVTQNSRVGVIGGNFKRNAQVFDAQGGGEYIIDDTTPQEYNLGGADANTSIYRHRGTGKETRLYGQSSTNEYRTNWYNGPFDHTGTTADTVAYITPSGTELPAQFLTDPAKKLRFRIAGRIQGTGGAKTIAVRRTNIDGSANEVLFSHTFSAGAVDQNFLWDIELAPRGDGSTGLYGWKNMIGDGDPMDMSYLSLSASLLVPNKSRFRLMVQTDNAADSILVRNFETYVQG